MARGGQVLEPLPRELGDSACSQEPERRVVAVDEAGGVEEQVRLAGPLEERPEALLGFLDLGHVPDDAGEEAFSLVDHLAHREVDHHGFPSRRRVWSVRPWPMMAAFPVWR